MMRHEKSVRLQVLKVLGVWAFNLFFSFRALMFLLCSYVFSSVRLERTY